MKGEPSRIHIHDIRALGRHGANPGERDAPQPFEIDLDLDVDLSKARRSDDLRDTIDYANVHRRVTEIVATTSYALLERLADEILTELMQDDRIEVARITIGKPNLLDGATPAVTIVRTRA